MTAESYPYIFELPSGTRIKVLEVSKHDAWYERRDRIEGKTFIATKPLRRGCSMFFKNEEDGIEYCFFGETTYQII